PHPRPRAAPVARPGRSAARGLLILLGMIEQPHGILAVISGEGGVFVQERAFVCGRCVLILWGQLV
ncbi:MAG: hypothetical protein ABI234_02385, partial [Ktedonobacteraceae bacterium]